MFKVNIKRDGSLTVNEMKKFTKLETKGANMAISRVNMCTNYEGILKGSTLIYLRLIKIKIRNCQDQSFMT